MIHRMNGLLGGFLGILVLVLTACGEPQMLPTVTRVVATPEMTPSPRSQVVPQVMSGNTPISPVPTETLAVPRPPEAQPTVWRPREIAAQVQQALANSLGVSPEAVPWTDLAQQVNPAELVCLDQLLGDLPTFGEGEALVYQYQDTPIYVVSSQGALWICRQAEVASRASPLSLEEARTAAVADLAQRLGIETSAIEVVKAEEVMWPDASAGCPQPGQAYAQVQTPGYEVVLVAGEVRYIYRGDKSRLFLCVTEEQ